MDELTALNRKLDSYRNDMISTMSRMISIKSISPMSGGTGEGKRAEFLERTLRSWGFKVDRYVYRDGTGTERPNLAVRYGAEKRTIWIVSHMDTVSEGDINLWKTDPFKAVVKDGRIYGRGTIDDGQPVISSMYALKALKELGTSMKYSFGLALVADEELGSEYGIQSMLRENLFKKDDLFLVPDSGVASGKEIEVAEKSIVWLKVTVHGKQAHASTPEMGVNAFRYLIRFFGLVDRELHKRYGRSNPIFNPPVSTFEMTKHEKNVDSINIMPGTEVAYLDCRVLPEYDKDEVVSYIRRMSRRKEFRDAKISFELVQDEEAPPPTSVDSEIVKLLKGAIKRQRGIVPKAVGIGGGTCAAYFRRKGLPSAVWFTCNNIAHQPNEYLVIKDMVEDAKVFAALFV
ncbi:MAG: M20 family metallo-hydrolase [Candidatus Marsarchaeota archaeon]|jgi:succinyl-diaminopimelate desuccinylase|nr:M20 family metallo-hydrolase [Candidatus Marsarchaeota archaeon]MCL5111889.1 M20 family metallo-hydrolase [Candidatus Marsarchaeota archaeon]